MGDEGNNAWWHGPVIGVCLTAATTVGGYVQSHWGGATKEYIDKAFTDFGAKLSRQHDDDERARAKDNDDLRQFVIVRTTPAAVPKVKKRKAEERREQ